MDKDKLIRMAIQCQLVNTSNREGVYMDSLEAFAKLVLKEAAARAAQPAPVQEPDKVLLKFYDAKDYPSLVAEMERHIQKLQAKLPKTPSFAPQRVREG